MGVEGGGSGRRFMGPPVLSLRSASPIVMFPGAPTEGVRGDEKQPLPDSLRPDSSYSDPFIEKMLTDPFWDSSGGGARVSVSTGHGHL